MEAIYSLKSLRQLVKKIQRGGKILVRSFVDLNKPTAGYLEISFGGFYIKRSVLRGYIYILKACMRACENYLRRDK